MKALLLTLTLFATSAQAEEITGKQILAHSYLAGYCNALKTLSDVQNNLDTKDGDVLFTALMESLRRTTRIQNTDDLVAQCNDSMKKYQQFNKWAEGVQEF